MKCYVVRDLLPRYLDGLTGEEASGEIKAHLETCEGCRTVYEQMAADIPQDLTPKEKNIDFFKKLKTRLRKQEGLIALGICLALIALIAFLKHFYIPVSYNQEHVSAEIEHTIAIPEPPYQTSWRDVDLLDFETTKAYLDGEYDDCGKRDFVRLQYYGFSNTHILKYGRTLNRNGEPVDIVYFCAARELWDVLFSAGEAQEDRRGSRAFFGNLDENTLYHAYTPRMTEIYYLPMRGTNWLKHLSDETFDEQREKGVQVFRGVI